MDKYNEPTQYEIYTKQLKDDYKELLAEDYQVVIKLPHQQLNWRVTYNGKNGKRVKSIEEMKGDEIITTSNFRGSMCSGWCSADIKYFKPMLAMKASSISKLNPSLVIESYYKKH